MSTHFLATPLRNENQAIMADLSNPSNMVVHEEVPMVFFEDLQQEIDRGTNILILSYILDKNKGIIKEPPSYHDVLREVLSTSILSSRQYNYIQDVLDRSKSIDTVDSIDLAFVSKQSATEKNKSIQDPMKIKANSKLVGNPCKNKPTNVSVDQNTIRLSQAEVVDPETSRKNIETTSSTLILGGQQDKDKGSSCDKIDLPSLSRVS